MENLGCAPLLFTPYNQNSSKAAFFPHKYKAPEITRDELIRSNNKTSGCQQEDNVATRDIQQLSLGMNKLVWKRCINSHNISPCLFLVLQLYVAQRVTPHKRQKTYILGSLSLAFNNRVRGVGINYLIDSSVDLVNVPRILPAVPCIKVSYTKYAHYEHLVLASQRYSLTRIKLDHFQLNSQLLRVNNPATPAQITKVTLKALETRQADVFLAFNSRVSNFFYLAPNIFTGLDFTVRVFSQMSLW